MTVETNNKLENLINVTFEKDRKQFTVKSFKQVNSLIVVLTTNGTFNFYEKEVDEFIEMLTPVKGNFPLVAHPLTNSEVPAPIIYQKTETHQKLENSLNAMIDKVLDNKDNIPQATALCNLTNTMINLEKQQLSMLRAAKKL